MKTLEEARELAQSLVSVGNQFGVKTTALITDMNQPLGRMIGNAVEIDESIEILNGNGPKDVCELTKQLAAELLVNSGIESDIDSAQRNLQNAIQTGEALKKLEEMVKNQGGDLNADRPRADESQVLAYDSGYVCRVDADRLGLAVIEMGGGRKEMGDSIDHSVGIEFLVRIGDKLEKDQPVANLFCHDDKSEFVANLISLSIGTSLLRLVHPS